MANFFNRIPKARLHYSKFDLSHEHKTTFNAGKVIPLLWLEGVPGDTFYMNANVLVRAQALISPMMHREDFKIRFYKVPKRLLCSYDDLEKAYTGGENGEPIDFPLFNYDPSDYGISANTGNYGVGSLLDYLGLPLPIKYKDDGTYEFFQPWSTPFVSPFPFLAYHRIYNDWLRNEETEKAVSESIYDELCFGSQFSTLNDITLDSLLHDSNGNNLYALGDLHNIGWERDYFTSALKSSQRGSQVTIPLAGLAPVVAPNIGSSEAQNATINTFDGGNKVNLNLGGPMLPQLFVDLDTASGIGAIALRTYMNIQAYRERLNQSGYRLKEWIKAIFDQNTKDSTLDYCTFLGGASFPVSVSSVAQTSASADGSTPQANLAGIANVVGRTPKTIKVHCDEPCIIMAVGWVLPRTGYSQGLGREWTRHDWTEEFNPYFETIGEQEILEQELYFDWSVESQQERDNSIFAYQSRYAEYKFRPDRISGDFRTSLTYWHKSRLFTSAPAFNNDFIKSNPSDRVFALSDDVTQMHYLADLYFDIKAIRPMRKYPQSKLW